MGLQLRSVADDLMTRDPERIALIDDAGTFSYREFRASVLSATARLRDAGLRPDDRLVIIDGPNRLPLIATFAAMRLGACATLINPRLTPDEVSTLATLVGGTPVAVTGDAVSDRAGLLGVPVIGSELMAAYDGDDSPVDADGSDAILLFTSGTTGLPKPVPVPWPTLTKRLTPYVNLAGAGVRMLCVPIHHVGGLIGSLVSVMGGSTLVIQPKFEAGEWLRLVEAHNVELTFIVPTMLARIVDHPDLASRDLSSLQTITYGASPMTDDLVAKLTVALPGVGFVNTFGQTETLGGITLSTPADALHPVHRTSVGKLVPGVEIKIVTPGTDDELGLG